MRKKPEILDSKIVYKGWLTVRKDILKVEGTEKPYPYDIVHLSDDGVAILPFLDKNTLLLAKQYRPPVQSILLELIQGGVRENETILQAAERELLEETGFIGKPEHMITFYPLPTCIDMRLHIMKATDLYKKQEPNLPLTESLELIKIPYKQVLEEIVSGKHKDSALVMAILYHEYSALK